MDTFDAGVPDSEGSDIEFHNDGPPRIVLGSEVSNDDMMHTTPEPAEFDSSDSDVDHYHTPEQDTEARSPPHSALSHRFRESPPKAQDGRGSGSDRKESTRESSLAVVISAPARLWEYDRVQVDSSAVDSVLEEMDGPGGELQYRIEFEDGREETVSLEELLQLRNGQNAWDFFNDDFIEDSHVDNQSSSSSMASGAGKRNRKATSNPGFVDSFENVGRHSDSEDQGGQKRRRLVQGKLVLNTRQSSRLSSRPRSAQNDNSEDSDEPLVTSRHGLQTRNYPLGRVTRQNSRSKNSNSDDEGELNQDLPQKSDDSDIIYGKPTKKKPTVRTRGPGRNMRSTKYDDETSSSEEKATRRSGRERITKNMREHDLDEEIYADEVAKTTAAKIISVREIYPSLPKEDPFRLFHRISCDSCKGMNTNSPKGPSPLVYCQGCSSSIHKYCLGYRSQREPMVTKVGDGHFVMQCRRCVGTARKKDPNAPRLDFCQGCNEPGMSCAAFSPRKTPKQEEKLREENEGDDPITPVPETLVNNAKHVLFRCISCQRGFHFEHLPPLKRISKTPGSEDELREQRLNEYSQNWTCKDCHDFPAKIQGLVAWRPKNRDKYIEGTVAAQVPEDEKEFLIKWEEKSYFKCTWMPGAWVWGKPYTALMRKAFYNRDEGVNMLPKYTNDSAIAEDLLRMEIVFDVDYADEFEPESEAADKAAISMVDRVLVKFRGLGYDEAVWEEPPSPKEQDRWTDFVAAYNEFVVGRYFKPETPSVMKDRIDHFRKLNFAKKVEMKKQPSALVGGQMMPYQMEGLNWLLYNFHQQKNVILADEMGLGKTIQIISLIAALVNDNPTCFPFLVVTPNSTCPNWRREIKKWAPGIRVVTFYGGKKAKEMALKYELCPDKSSALRAHVVVTSYEGPVDDSSKAFFRKVKWAGLIVDEGQRLKNDANLLYVALKAMKVPFQVLLTGTPLQNNKRELFNLLQFLDKSVDAAALDEEYAELTKENLPGLHELIRPFFLRRTKLQVLKFLPPMAQVILPTTMSLVQKKLYKSILAKNPELIKAIFGQSKTVLRPAERGNLNNILMQLRKCLCHPFMYSSAIEERNVDTAASHRNLIDASSKFQLLEIMLPKLRERGHRVLLFSQFLDNLDLVEDFLSGVDLPFARLDGNINALEKQKRIDAFNAPNSKLFAFLLSTRAGGVGINLATADTVIIMDPDFNPHQDIQALSRAHRIGQKKKVLVFNLMTKDTAEEKIVQIGRKKMALDQALIESMGAEDEAGIDLESILSHGAAALFNDDNQNDIHYDSASVDKLLDRTQVENTKADENNTAESQFSFARVWANDKADLTEEIEDTVDDAIAPNPSVWDAILKQREADAAAEAAANRQTFGRGKRIRNTVAYQNEADLDDAMADTPEKPKPKRGSENSNSDAEFAGQESEPDEDSDVGHINPQELEQHAERVRNAGVLATSTPSKDRLLGLEVQMSNPFPPQHKSHYPTTTERFPPKSTTPNDFTKVNSNGFRVTAPPNDSTKVNSNGFRTATPSNFIRVNSDGFRVTVSGSEAPQKPSQQPSKASGLQSQIHDQQNHRVPSAGSNQSQAQQRPIHGPAILPRGRINSVRTNHSSESFRTQSFKPRQDPLPTAQRFCSSCRKTHGREGCPTKTSDAHSRPKQVEICGLCGIAHFSASKTCPDLASETQLRLMLDALRGSREPQDQKVHVEQYLRKQLAERVRAKKERSKA